MSREATLRKDSIRAQFEELAESIEDPLVVYLIGGGALTLHELKNATKDIDLIVEQESDLDQLRDSLESVGYAPPDDLDEEYEQMDAAFILEKGIRRFDVFNEQVAGVLVLSESMVERSEILFKNGPLVVRGCSLNDIFVFKSVVNREDDVDDMIVLAETGLDYDLILDEIHCQLRLVGDDHFIGSIKFKLERIENKGIRLDIQGVIEDLYSKSLAADKVARGIRNGMEREFSNDIYEGVPVEFVQDFVGSSDEFDQGREWLEEMGRMKEATDGSLVFDERAD